MADLKAQQVFAAGTWNGMTFTEADLDGMVRAFDALALAGRVPLKFGHDSAKPMKDGKPALGWVQRMYREGRTLLADFSNVPDAVMTAIREKLYKHVSIELLQNVKAGTREIPWVPDAVALLGADQPAVGILKELEALTMSARAALRFDARVAFTRDFQSTNGAKASMSEAEIAELKRKLAEAEANAAKFKDNADKVTAEREAEKRTAHVEKLKGLAQSAVNAGKVAPATMTAFSVRFGKDDSESIMGFTAEDVEAWLKTCAPADKVSKTKMTTEEGKTMKFTADTNAQAMELVVAESARALGYEPKDVWSNPEIAHRVFARVQFSRPALYKAYVADPAGDYKTEDQEAA